MSRPTMMTVEVHTKKVGAFGVCEQPIRAPGIAHGGHTQTIVIWEDEWPEVEMAVVSGLLTWAVPLQRGLAGPLWRRDER